MTSISQHTNKPVIRLGLWTGAWVISMAIATFGSQFLWESQALTYAAVIANLGLGIGVILVNIRYLKTLDEMMQQVQLEAMGLSLGIGVIAGLSYSLLDTTNIIVSDAEISYLVMLSSIVYIVSLIINIRRYK